MMYCRGRIQLTALFVAGQLRVRMPRRLGAGHRMSGQAGMPGRESNTGAVQDEAQAEHDTQQE